MKQVKFFGLQVGSLLFFKPVNESGTCLAQELTMTEGLTTAHRIQQYLRFFLEQPHKCFWAKIDTLGLNGTE